MGSILSKPKMPPPPKPIQYTPPPLPEPKPVVEAPVPMDETNRQSARRTEMLQKASAKQSGRASTILSETDKLGG